ncbi:MAG: hypothetical protein L0G51_06605 [Lactococcus lactis]|nr:hypothetical protein [Lactococcus lactis]
MKEFTEDMLVAQFKKYFEDKTGKLILENINFCETVMGTPQRFTMNLL